MGKRPNPITTSDAKSAIRQDRGPRVRVVQSEEVEEQAPIEVDDSGLSLEDLGQAYAMLLNRGALPYEEAKEEVDPVAVGVADGGEATDDQTSEFSPPPRMEAASVDLEDEMIGTAEEDVACALTPRSILEALLFVGHPENEPLTAVQVASLMRGVRADEIDDLVRDLNHEYDLIGVPYRIASEGSGYRMVLREEFSALREVFYGKIKEARLSQAAIDILAVVAYRQPLTQKAIDAQRGKASSGILGQLVRRGLLRIERLPENPREILYRTTARFLDLFGLDSLDDLPRSQELER